MREVFKKAILIAVALIFCAFSGYSVLTALNGAESETQIAMHASEAPTLAAPTPTASSTPTPTPEPTPSPEPTPTPEPYTEIVIGGAGDIMCHVRQADDAYAAAGEEGYSFLHWFKYIKPALEYPDLMIANLEGPIAGEEKEYNGYPYFNFPDAITDAIVYSGIDVILNANNHVMDKGIDGLKRTLDVLDDAGIAHTGIWKSAEERSNPLVIDVNGIKVGVVSATYSLNGFEKGIDSETLEYLVCFIEKEQVKAQIDLCKKNGAEVIVVSPHMGDELQTHTRKGIRDLARGYIEMGADIVFAHHPHVVQPVEKYETVLEDGTNRSGIIYYSLGNLVSGQYGVIKEVGAIGYVNLRRDNMTGEIEITAARYLPVYTLRHGERGYLYHIVPLGHCLDNPEYIADLEPIRSRFIRMQSAWEIVTEVMGEEPAELIKYIPEE